MASTATKVWFGQSKRATLFKGTCFKILLLIFCVFFRNSFQRLCRKVTLVRTEDDPHEATGRHIGLQSRTVLVHPFSGYLDCNIVPPTSAPPLRSHCHLVAREPDFGAVAPRSVTDRASSVVLIEGLVSSLCLEDELVIGLDPHVLVSEPPATYICSKDRRQTEGGDKREKAKNRH